MGFVFQGLLEVILDALTTIAALFFSSFKTYFGIDIGFNSYSSSGSILSNNKAGTFVDWWDAVSKADEGAGLFDIVFNGTHQYMNVFRVTAFVIIILISVFQFLKVYWTPGDGAEHPFSLIKNFIVSSVLVYLSYPLFVAIEYPLNEIYRMFSDIEVSKADNLIERYTKTFNVETLQDMAQATFNKSGATKDTLGLMVDQQIEQALLVAVIIIAIICLLAILWNFFKLLIEIADRYITLGLLFYLSPIAVSTLASSSTKRIFSSYLQMISGQVLVLCLTSFFINVFIGAMSNTPVMRENGNLMAVLIYLLLLVGWLRIGQRMDMIINSLGLSTAQTGGAIAGALMGSAATITYGMQAITRARSMKNSSGTGGSSGFKPGISNSNFRPGDPLKPSDMKRDSNGNLTKMSAEKVAFAGAGDPNTFKGKDAMTAASVATNGKLPASMSGVKGLESASYKGGKGNLGFKDGSRLEIGSSKSFNGIKGAHSYNYGSGDKSIILGATAGSNSYSAQALDKATGGGTSTVQSFVKSATDSQGKRIFDASATVRNISNSQTGQVGVHNIENGLGKATHQAHNAAISNVDTYSPSHVKMNSGSSGASYQKVVDLGHADFGNIPTEPYVSVGADDLSKQVFKETFSNFETTPTYQGELNPDFADHISNVHTETMESGFEYAAWQTDNGLSGVTIQATDINPDFVNKNADLIHDYIVMSTDSNGVPMWSTAKDSPAYSVIFDNPECITGVDSNITENKIFGESAVGDAFSHSNFEINEDIANDTPKDMYHKFK